MTGRRGRFAWLVRGALLAAPAVVGSAAPSPALLSAQQPTAPAPTAQPQTERPGIDISPTGAFLRALALPGWGHSALGSHVRGAFYFGAESATAYTLIRSRIRLLEARERVAFREAFVREQLALAGVVDEEEVDAELDSDPTLTELRRLEESRADQQEDMIALGIFLVFLSGADAYVTAHLSRFPDPLEVEVQPVGGGRVELSLRWPLPN